MLLAGPLEGELEQTLDERIVVEPGSFPEPGVGARRREPVGTHPRRARVRAAPAERPEAHVVNVSSAGGLMPARVHGPYCTTKHAVIGLSKALRADLELKGADIGVIVVCRGAVSTAITRPSSRRKSCLVFVSRLTKFGTCGFSCMIRPMP